MKTIEQVLDALRSKVVTSQALTEPGEIAWDQIIREVCQESSILKEDVVVPQGNTYYYATARLDLINQSSSISDSDTAAQANLGPFGRPLGVKGVLEAQSEADLVALKIIHSVQAAPSDCAALLRFIMRGLCGITLQQLASNDSEVLPHTKALSDALTACHANVKKSNLHHFTRCINAAIKYREARQKALRLQEAGESELSASVSRVVQGWLETHGSYIQVGTRYMQLASAISPHNMFGVLILDLLGFTPNKLAVYPENKFSLLLKLFTNDGNEVLQRAGALGVSKDFSSALHVIIKFILPGAEKVLCSAFAEAKAAGTVGEHALYSILVPSRQGINDQDKCHRFGLLIPGEDSMEPVFLPDPELLNHRYN